MTFPLVVVAGADDRLRDALRAESPNAFAPNGALVMEPTPAGLTTAHSAELIGRARVVLRDLKETLPVNIVVLAVTPDNREDDAFRAMFFPFALYVTVRAPDLSATMSRNRANAAVNVFVSQLKRAATQARARADLVKGVVSKANMSPLLLPLRNFQDPQLRLTLDAIHAGLGTAIDPLAFIQAEERRFVAAVPYVTPDGSTRRCFSDGRHLFKSPGRHRHGYYQNSQDQQHGPFCILNARARLGGSYPHDFHFDCEPLRTLARTYPNCHGAPCPPKPTYVNISPGDGVI